MAKMKAYTERELYNYYHQVLREVSITEDEIVQTIQKTLDMMIKNQEDQILGLGRENPFDKLSKDKANSVDDLMASFQESLIQAENDEGQRKKLNIKLSPETIEHINKEVRAEFEKGTSLFQSSKVYSYLKEDKSDLASELKLRASSPFNLHLQMLKLWHEFNQ